MLKQVLMPFYELINEARLRVGESAPKIADEVMRAAFPKTVDASEMEGCDKMLRKGVVEAVKTYIRKPPVSERQRSFEDIDPEFMPLAEQLQSTSYFVPSVFGGEYVAVPDMIAQPDLLKSTEQYIWLKGQECMSEATRLRELHEAVTSRSR